MNVELAKEQDLWNEYAERNAPDNLYYRWVWRDVIEETFGHKPHYLVAMDGGKVRGILPLMSIRSRLFGKFLVSVPFFSYGGVLADTPEAREGLLAGAAELGRELGVRHIELRQGEECPLSWQGTSSKVTMEIHLPATADQFWKSISSGLRNKIRNSQKYGFRVQWGGIEDVDTFYKIWATNMRNLGTPAYPRRFFENQVRRLSGRIRILSLWDGTEPMTAAFLTSHAQTLELPWSASLPEYRKKYSPVLMYWTFIQKAIEEGFRKIDLGRCSPGGGTYEFKRHWNPVERPLHWYYWLAPGASMPHLNAGNTNFKLAIEIWKRLPLAVANGIGPHVVRSLP